jgi:hypothetical protein
MAPTFKAALAEEKDTVALGAVSRRASSRD